MCISSSSKRNSSSARCLLLFPLSIRSISASFSALLFYSTYLRIWEANLEWTLPYPIAECHRRFSCTTMCDPISSVYFSYLWPETERELCWLSFNRLPSCQCAYFASSSPFTDEDYGQPALLSRDRWIGRSLGLTRWIEDGPRRRWRRRRRGEEF